MITSCNILQHTIYTFYLIKTIAFYGLNLMLIPKHTVGLSSFAFLLNCTGKFLNEKYFLNLKVQIFIFIQIFIYDYCRKLYNMHFTKTTKTEKRLFENRSSLMQRIDVFRLHCVFKYLRLT